MRRQMLTIDKVQFLRLILQLIMTPQFTTPMFSPLERKRWRDGSRSYMPNRLLSTKDSTRTVLLLALEKASLRLVICFIPLRAQIADNDSDHIPEDYCNVCCDEIEEILKHILCSCSDSQIENSKQGLLWRFRLYRGPSLRFSRVL